MLKPSTEYLIELIKSLTQTEKRSFRIATNALIGKEDKLFVLLFDFIDQCNEYNEAELLKKNPQFKKSQLPNIKSNLYKHLLNNLRHLSRNKKELEVREMMDYAHILHSKGLYHAALEILNKANRYATEINDQVMEYAALDYERKIENQYITGSMVMKAESLKKTTDFIIKQLNIQNSLANLNLSLYGIYLKYGYVKDKKDLDFVNTFFESHLPDVRIAELGFYEKSYYYQSFVWYHHMIQDFVNYYKYAQKWVDLFEEYPVMKKVELSLFHKSLHNVLNALYMANKRSKFAEALSFYLDLEEQVLKEGNKNESSNYLIFKYLHSLNDIILNATFDEGKKQLPQLELILKKNTYNWDTNRVMVFYYKIACIYFGADQYHKALDYLNKIINMPISNLREDIQAYSRILSLISHFELGNETLVKYQIMSVYRFLSKQEDLNAVHKEIFNFLRKTPKISKSEIRKEFSSLRKALQKYTKDTFERRPFLYLDIIAWLDSKIELKRIQDIIRDRKENIL